MGNSLKTEPGWKPKQRGPSDRLLIALLGAFVALVECWHAISPAEASEGTEIIRRVSKMEAKVDVLVVDVAVLKAEKAGRK